VNSYPLDLNFGTFEKNLLSERIAARLLLLIKDRELRPGDRLPPERELSAMMNVSRPSLREALSALSIMGVINHMHGSGTFVASLEPARLIEHLDFILSLDNSTLLDLFEARRIIEVNLSGIAAEKITNAEIDGLEHCLALSEETYNNPKRFSECDLEIHTRISDAAHNKILSILMATINKLNVYSRTRTGEFPDVREQSVLAHKRIILAIKSHDPIAARAAMKEHLDYIESRIKTLLQEPEL
jgi:GntR family transcriptional repressor for pyruvate dehydrogenase complex